MRSWLVFVGAIFVGGALTACLRTRADLRQETEQKTEMKSQLSQLQRSEARDELRFQEYETQFRQINGRMESLEYKWEQSQRLKEETLSSQEAEKSQREERMRIFEEALRALEGQVQQLTQELELIKSENAALALAKEKQAVSLQKGNFKSATEAFAKKDWKAAIVGFQKYREMNPKGRHYALATFKIGVCFRELGMAADSKAFFEEVVEKFPKNKEAAQAKTYLKSLK